MLSGAAFNALLKTLEEPPGEVRFVLASEAAHQLLPTIRSRCLGHTMAWPKQAEMLPQSRWVGRDFADAARAMHEGRAAEDLIHGQASPEEAEALRDDGIAAMPLLVPIIPPDLAN